MRNIVVPNGIINCISDTVAVTFIMSIHIRLQTFRKFSPVSLTFDLWS